MAQTPVSKALLSTALAETSPIGKAGINAWILQQPPYNLSGRKVAIGQVEIGRPGLWGFDKISRRNRAMMPTQVFLQDQPAVPNQDLDDHAHSVAALMISRDKTVRGVAPAARLYSSAIGNLTRSAQPEECRALNYIALQGGHLRGGSLRGINLSFGESLQMDPRPNATLDGQALLTLCLDWSARIHDVTYVVAGNQGEGGIPIPTDNFNGLNVAFTRRVGGNFAKVDFANLGNELAGIAQRQVGQERNLAGRRSISLVAPGHELALLHPDGTTVTGSGTSFAAPLVTGTLALLQDYSRRRLQSPTPDPHWSRHSHRHEVMRAVLLNAADKIADTGDGHALGMARTIQDQQGKTWLESIAYRDPSISLDLQMGAGQLNAFRAYQQFSAGEYDARQPIPAQGWNYGTITPKLVFQDYVFAQPLAANSFLAATLTWDRWVDLNDQNQNGEFDLKESFRDRGLNNLDLYLLPADAQNLNANLHASVSTVDNLEHLFFRIPKTGRYKLRVVYRQATDHPEQPYGLAWWGMFSAS
jgi:hypothetical protein